MKRQQNTTIQLFNFIFESLKYEAPPLKSTSFIHISKISLRRLVEDGTHTVYIFWRSKNDGYVSLS